MLSCFSDTFQSIHDSSIKSCCRNRTARYYFPFFLLHWGFLSVMTHRPLLLFCYERGEPCRQNINQVSKDSVSKHNTFTVHLLRKRVNLLQCCNSRNSTQEGFCLFVFLLRADIKTLKLAAEPCDRLTVLDWDFVLYVKVLCCNCGKHEPPPEAHPSGWISISCEQLFMR